MAWDTTLVTMVRHLVNDLGGNNEFDDDRLKNSIVVSGLLVSQEFKFSQSYTFDLDTPDISPDPTKTNTYDGEAIALLTLRSACMLDVGRYQNAVANGVRIRDGDSEVETTGAFRGYNDILNKGPCASYQNMVKRIQHDNSMKVGKAVMTPFTHEDRHDTIVSSVEEFFNGFGV